MIKILCGDSVYQIINEYPELKDVLFSLGFEDIVKPGMLQTAGRFMTLEKGSRLKNISLDVIKAEFEKNGFTIE